MSLSSAWDSIGEAIAVKKNEVMYCDFLQPLDKQKFGVKDLRGAHVVVIYSVHGAIMAHISPRPQFNLDDDDVSAETLEIDSAMDQLRDMYQQYYDLGHFPSPGTNVYVIHAKIRGDIDVALPEEKDFIHSKLEEMGLMELEEVHYPVEDEFGGMPDATTGTVLLMGGSGVIYPALRVWGALVIPGGDENSEGSVIVPTQDQDIQDNQSF